MSAEDASESISMRAGIGNWLAFKRTKYSIDSILEAAAAWRSAMSGVDKAWLCWNVHPDWCLAQQRLVESIGWVPVVGFDPRVGPPPLTRTSILIDFNAPFSFGVMWPHFPLEFAFAYAKKIAFWHSDLLLRQANLKMARELFEGLADGELAVTQPTESWRALLSPRHRRFWELLGCVTSGASKDLFETGCGWWINFAEHPNCKDPQEYKRRKSYYWDHGTGIRYWAKRYRKPVKVIPEALIAEGHFTRINNSAYVSSAGGGDWRRNLAIDLAQNHQLDVAARKLGIEKIVLQGSAVER